MLHRQLLFQAVLCFFWAIFQSLGPTLFVPAVLGFMADPSQRDYVGWIWVVAFFVNNLLANIFTAHMAWQGSLVATEARAAIMGLVIRKGASLPTASVTKRAGMIVNFSSSDAQRIFMLLTFGMGGVGGAFLMAALSTALLVQFGIPSIAPVFIVLAILPYLVVTSKLGCVPSLQPASPPHSHSQESDPLRRSKFAARVLPISDRRVRLMGEIVNAIKLIKIQAWVSSFADAVNRVRQSELVQRYKSTSVLALVEFSTLFGSVAQFVFMATWIAL